MGEWIDTRNCEPLVNEQYLVQTVYGRITPMEYTLEGGWNTHFEDDKLRNGFAMNDGYIVRWYKVEKPKPVPRKWVKEYVNARLKHYEEGGE